MVVTNEDEEVHLVVTRHNLSSKFCGVSIDGTFVDKRWPRDGAACDEVDLAIDAFKDGRDSSLVDWLRTCLV